MKSEKPSPGATRAAERICEKTGPEYGVRYDDDSIVEIAQIIDEETELKRLIDAAQNIVTDLESGLDEPIIVDKHPAVKTRLEIIAGREITKARIGPLKEAIARAKGGVDADFSEGTTTIAIGQAGGAKVRGTP